MNDLTAKEREVLARAAKRASGYVCPTNGLHGAAQASVLRSLRDKQYITDEAAPVITDLGLFALL